MDELRRLLIEGLEEAHQTLGAAAFRARSLGDQYTARKIGNIRVHISGLIDDHKGGDCVSAPGVVE